MTVWKRYALSLLVAAGLVLGLSAAPAGAEAPVPAAAPAAVAQASAAKNPVCVAGPTQYLAIYDYFHCGGGFWSFPQTHFTLGACYPMSGLSGPNPPDTGNWSNSMSSGVNRMAYAVQFFDGGSCQLPVLFAMNPNTIRTTLNTIANNKASSFKVFVP